MKLSLFAHMQRVDNPDIPAETLYEQFISLCKAADDGGMHAVWSGEHHVMNFTIAPNPFMTVVDLASRTRNVRLGTGTVVAPFWHPIKLAGEAAMADLITGGRLEVGIARGAYVYEYERLMPGMDAYQAGQRMREIVPAVQKLWAGDYAHDGEFYSFPTSVSTPRPSRPPPMWIAARDAASHDFAVGGGCHVQVTPLWQGDDEVKTLVGRFDDACEKHNTRPRIMLLQHTYVGKTDEEVEAATNALAKFYCYFGAWFKNARPVTNGMMAPLSADDMAAMAPYAPAEIRKNLVIGKPAEVISRLRQYEDWGYDEYAFWIDSGMDYEQQYASLSRFIDEVMPAFS